jgi:predicted nicotinamide N-methyase
MLTDAATSPVFTETPASAIPQVGQEKVIIEKRTFIIERPMDSDRILDDPTIHAANLRDDYMPYWCDIWPAARMMAKVILHEPREQFDLCSGDTVEALELGCGLGLAGLAALARGMRVTFTDYDLTALRFAERNARLNGFQNFRTLPLDWRFPPDDLKVPLLIAADLTYEIRNIDPLLAIIKKLLLPEGVCLLTDPDRSPAPHLRERLAKEGLPYTTCFVRAGEPGRERTKGTLYRISVRNSGA